MTRLYTGLNDKKGNQIYEGGILLNPFARDLWTVVLKNGVYEAWLIPNSGLIGHYDNEYPAYTEPLEDVCEVFEVVGNVEDNADWLAHVNQT